MTYEEVADQIAALCNDLKVICSEIMLDSYNDVYRATYFWACCWWYELIDNFRSYIAVSRNDKYPAEKIQSVIENGRTFISIAQAGKIKLDEWFKPNPFDNYL